MRTLTRVAFAGLVLTTTGCQFFASKDRDVVQKGYRGTAMEVNYVARNQEQAMAELAKKMPAILPPAGESPPGPLPWQNVQVLNDIPVAEFNRTMIAMATWVAGGPGNCAYCHNLAAFASDTYPDGKAIYTKAVARRMIQMTRNINSEWTEHVGNTGVTCYTCHMGKPLPNGLWFYTNENQLLRHYLDGAGARVVSHTVSPSPENRSSVKQTEWTYALMITQSQALGVNCTFCHNSRQFSSWEQAPPQRVTAYAGIQMLRDVNTNYLAPLAGTYHPSRLGPMGDAPKAQCVTCHNGVYKPLYGFQMAKHYPAVWGTHTDWTTPLPPAFTTPPAPPVIDTAAVVADSLATPMASPASPVVPPTGR
ncbi:MAG: photosynthetic reaction center cytochrome PufC [Gemmatimonadota bacterium]|nr:photosynthetic reaction center cytochrome PufC [Gemmatimonadota bacterium]MDQ8149781.1 photosynthetic reaction center cytochrome PufC [Gemmatimonadota bacterium]MDQ8177207.1 photosynthetic reaction center cytochrome PufC [Gemmatimonadota bacterium]